MEQFINPSATFTGSAADDYSIKICGSCWGYVGEYRIGGPTEKCTCNRDLSLFQRINELEKRIEKLENERS